MRTTYVIENNKFFVVNESKEHSYYSKREISEKEYKKSTESLYYYQMINNKDDVLNGKYSCCGLVHENKESKEFYINFYLNHDSRYGSSKVVDYIEKLVIVKGFRGNIAERDGLAISSEDIIEVYSK